MGLSVFEEKLFVDRKICCKLKKINKHYKIIKLKKNFFDAMLKNNSNNKLKCYRELIKLLNKKISNITFKKLDFIYIINIILADNNNNIYYQQILNIGTNIEIQNIFSTNKIIKKNFRNYVNNSLYIPQLSILDFIVVINKSKNKNWTNKVFGTLNVFSYYSQGTTTFTSENTIIPKITVTKGTYNAMTSDVSGKYTGLSFNSGFEGTVVFSSVTPDTVFGMLSIAKGGVCGFYYNEFYYCAGGGGGGIIYSENIYKDLDIVLDRNVISTIIVDNTGSSLSAYSSKYGTKILTKSFVGGQGSIYNDYKGGKGGSTNTPTKTCSYNGGDGATSKYPYTTGSDSKLISVIVPNSNETVFCGGGSGGFNKNNTNPGTANGGNGYGGVGCPSGQNIPNPNNYTNAFGGNYGGGASGKIKYDRLEKESAITQNSGDGKLYIWWSNS